jgi:predicted transcriptional regulator
VTTLTPLELAIMKSLWRRGSAPVKDVRPDLLPDRDLAYTTVMTVMARLFKKGIVRRAKKSRAHIYEPAFSEAEVRADAVSGLVDSFFSGSETRLKAYLGPHPEPAPSRASRPKVTPVEATIDDSLL